MNPAGQFGTAGLMSPEGGRITENFKAPQLRNIYQKAGMFGTSLQRFAHGPADSRLVFRNDGERGYVDSFFSDPVFKFSLPRCNHAAYRWRPSAGDRFGSGPIVGQQVTWRPRRFPMLRPKRAARVDESLRRWSPHRQPRGASDLTVRGHRRREYFRPRANRQHVVDEIRPYERLNDGALRNLASAARSHWLSRVHRRERGGASRSNLQ